MYSGAYVIQKLVSGQVVYMSVLMALGSTHHDCFNILEFAHFVPFWLLFGHFVAFQIFVLIFCAIPVFV